MTDNKSAADTTTTTTITEETTMKAGLKRKRSDESAKMCIPVLNENVQEKFLEAYEGFQAVHLPDFLGVRRRRQQQQKEKQLSLSGKMTWESVDGLFASLDKDKESWCVENGQASTTQEMQEFLHSCQHDRGYCSFLVQNDKQILEGTIQKDLPVTDILEKSEWTYGPGLWFFFGRNPQGSPPLEGRKEHTDSVAHDGTWHYQLSGVKRWYLRPTEELLKQTKNFGTATPNNDDDDDDESSDAAAASFATPLVVDCREGDVLVVNTRLWWHRTEIPDQPSPSVSYARDFYFSQEAADRSGAAATMSNVDGLYASKDVDVDEIIFTEHDMPNAELHRSKDNPNCRVSEMDDGTSVLVASRPIRAGEFFCVAETDDEDEEDDEDIDVEVEIAGDDDEEEEEEEDGGDETTETFEAPPSCLAVPRRKWGQFLGR